MSFVRLVLCTNIRCILKQNGSKCDLKHKLLPIHRKKLRISETFRASGRYEDCITFYFCDILKTFFQKSVVHTDHLKNTVLQGIKFKTRNERLWIKTEKGCLRVCMWISVYMG